MGFKEMRIKAGITAQETAQYMEVTEAAVSYWENGIHMPRSSKLAKLADYYECTVDELLDHGEDGENHAENKMDSQIHTEETGASSDGLCAGIGEAVQDSEERHIS